VSREQTTAKKKNPRTIANDPVVPVGEGENGTDDQAKKKKLENDIVKNNGWVKKTPKRRDFQNKKEKGRGGKQASHNRLLSTGKGKRNNPEKRKRNHPAPQNTIRGGVERITGRGGFPSKKQKQKAFPQITTATEKLETKTLQKTNQVPLQTGKIKTGRGERKNATFNDI